MQGRLAISHSHFSEKNLECYNNMLKSLHLIANTKTSCALLVQKKNACNVLDFGQARCLRILFLFIYIEYVLYR